MIAAVAGAAAALVVLLAGRGGVWQHRSRAPEDLGPADEPVLRRLRVPLVALGAVGGWVVVGGWWGVAVGSLGGVLGWRALERAESPTAARRRLQIARDLPLVVELLGAVLAGGAPPSSAVLVVADAVGGPVADDLRGAHHRLLLGIDPVTVWRTLAGPLQPLGRTMARAYESGSSVVAAVEACAAELRTSNRARVEAKARSVEVRAAVPLGICFLPAFVVLGVVPMTVGIFSSLRLFG